VQCFVVAGDCFQDAATHAAPAAVVEATSVITTTRRERTIVIHIHEPATAPCVGVVRAPFYGVLFRAQLERRLAGGAPAPESVRPHGEKETKRQRPALCWGFTSLLQGANQRRHSDIGSIA
jgi:hypothetical protein